jgi:hypothetical protein
MWGNNYNVLKIEAEGHRLQLATWSTPTPDEGDWLLLSNGEGGTTRYRAEGVRYCGNPRDMCFVEASFAPRARRSVMGEEVLKASSEAMEAVDFAVEQCGPREALSFLSDWRRGFPYGAWPGWISWLETRPSAPSEDDVVEAARWMSAIPMIRTERGTWSKVHYEQDGTIGRDVTADEADAVGAWQFHMLKPDSAIARAALAAMSQGESDAQP